MVIQQLIYIAYVGVSFLNKGLYIKHEQNKWEIFGRVRTKYTHTEFVFVNISYL